MAGLVSYASSDEENEGPLQDASPKAQTSIASGPPLGSQNVPTRGDHPSQPQNADERIQYQHIPAASTLSSPPNLDPKAPGEEDRSQPPPPASSSPSSQPIIGPMFPGPSLPSAGSNLPESLPTDPADAASAEDGSAPLSPYSSTRALIHDLTLPSVPNLDIPPSPSSSPSSPPPIIDKKFQEFLDLKRKGTHFHSKLESSAALRNPSLTDKLLAFVDVAGSAQYETTLPPDLYDPGGFPDWAHRDGLREAREALVKEREGEKATVRGVDFVSSTSTTPLGGGTQVAGLSRGDKRKSAWK